MHDGVPYQVVTGSSLLGDFSPDDHNTSKSSAMAVAAGETGPAVWIQPDPSRGDDSEGTRVRFAAL